MNKKTAPIKNNKLLNSILLSVKTMDIRVFVMFKIQLNTGLRISDVIDLKINDFVQNDKFEKYLNIFEKRTGKQTMIFINEEIIQAVKLLQKEKNLTDTDFLFTGRKNKNKPMSMTHIHRLYKEVGEKSGISYFGTHSLRKTWGYLAYTKTKDIALQMECFNHSSPKVTLLYIGITQDTKDELYSKLLV